MWTRAVLFLDQESVVWVSQVRVCGQEHRWVVRTFENWKWQTVKRLKSVKQCVKCQRWQLVLSQVFCLLCQHGDEWVTAYQWAFYSVLPSFVPCAIPVCHQLFMFCLMMSLMSSSMSRKIRRREKPFLSQSQHAALMCAWSQFSKTQAKKDVEKIQYFLSQ